MEEVEVLEIEEDARILFAFRSRKRKFRKTNTEFKGSAKEKRK